jgi:hypothetical protein
MKRTVITIIGVLFLSWPGFLLASNVPNDPYLKDQWYISRVQADRAWQRINSSPNIVIAVIDSGVQIDHPDLRDNIWTNGNELIDGLDSDSNGFIDDLNGWDFVNNVADPSPKFDEGFTESGLSHGTMVAGIIGAVGDNNIGVAGISWRTQIMPLRALNARGEGRVSDVVRAIDYAINNGADIINLSFVGFDFSESLKAAINRASLAGVIVVAAAGNESENGAGYDTAETPVYPACYGQNNGLVLGVVATDALDQKSNFSSYGFSCVDIAAPGISFFNTITQGSNLHDPNLLYDGYWSGTSMAAPLVSATLALVAEMNPLLSPIEIVNVVLRSADNISLLNPNYLGQLGAGRVNVHKAVELAREMLYNKLPRLLISASSLEDKQTQFLDKSGNLVQDFILEEKINVASGDLNGNGQEEIVVANIYGQKPEIRIYDQATNLLGRFFAYHPNFMGGINLAVFDVNDDGLAEIIVGAGPGGGPHVRVFNHKGELKSQFFAGSLDFKGGVKVAAGSVDGKAGGQIVTTLGQGSEPVVKIFNYRGNILGAFLAFEKEFRGGLTVAVANLDGRVDRKDEIVVAPLNDKEARIKIFSDKGVLKRSFLAFHSNFKGGVSLALGDLNNNGLADIALGALAGGAPHVRIFNGRGVLLESFYAYEKEFLGGINLGIVNLIN